jgi:hypothetical protein
MIVTSWHFAGKPLESVTDELPFLWAGVPHPFIFTGNFRPCRKLDLLLAGLALIFKTHLANKCIFVQKELSKKTPPAPF